MKISKTQRHVIVAILGTLIFLSIYIGIFMIIKNKINQISFLQNEVDVEIKKDQRLHSTKQLVADLEKELVYIDTYFIPVDGVVDFLENLEEIGSTIGVSVDINSVNVGENTEDSIPYEFLEISFTSSGDWIGIIQLISLLETFPLGLTVERMQLEKSQDLDSNTDFWHLNTNITVLKLK